MDAAAHCVRRSIRRLCDVHPPICVGAFDNPLATERYTLITGMTVILCCDCCQESMVKNSSLGSPNCHCTAAQGQKPEHPCMVRSNFMRGPVRISGGCMEPVLVDGQWADVLPRRFYLPGDVVVTERTHNHQAHRVLGYRPSWEGWAVITRADDAHEPDPAIIVDRIVGRVDVRVSLGDRANAIRGYGRALWRWLRRARS